MKGKWTMTTQKENKSVENHCMTSRDNIVRVN